VKLKHWPRFGVAKYGTVIVQWYVVHSHKRRLAGSMIDNEFEVCFELLLLIVLAKRRMYVAWAGLPANPISRGRKKNTGKSMHR
jgi:hypothetical protein